MPTFIEWFAIQKQKKFLAHTYLLTARHNHPHRLTGLSLTGTLTYAIDERLFTSNASPSNGATCYTYEYALDFADASPFTRYFEDRTPFTHVLSSLLAAREFALLHRPVEFWQFIQQNNFDALADEIIGTMVRKTYQYSTGTSTWSLIATDPAQDILLQWFFDISAGGDPASGGKNGTGDEQKAEILLSTAWTGVGASVFNTIFDLTVKRFPWDDPWTAESTQFATAFSDFLAAENTADGAGHSGTCGLTLNFLT